MSCPRTAAPTLAELLAHPEQADDLTPAEARALLPSVLALQTAVLARALSGPAASADGDRLLTVAEAAAQLGVSRDWLYRRADRLPFTVRLGRQLRFSRRRLAEYLAAPSTSSRSRPMALRPS